MVQHVGDCENDKFQFVVIKIEHVMMYKKNHKAPKNHLEANGHGIMYIKKKLN
jgi:hypothetical protein